ncbi:hypothetical protein KEM55_000778 [Ascosphaera atra]|nr:hypothetical protein KEM55_000778 [Ascosphaera atra]
MASATPPPKPPSVPPPLITPPAPAAAASMARSGFPALASMLGRLTLLLFWLVSSLASALTRPRPQALLAGPSTLAAYPRLKLSDDVIAVSSAACFV